MKNILLFSSIFILISCGKTSEHAGHDMDGDEESEGPNQALYNQVMDIHDEIMPKMEDIYRLKKGFLEEIANAPAMPAEQKKNIEIMISALDSANNAMMDWMHHFNPKPDSTDQEAAREYLETEMERIKKVRDLTNETLDKAKKVSEKN